MKLLSKILFSLMVLIFSTHAYARDRIALVIGNAAYDSQPLANPANDARDMASMLRKLDFQVSVLKNANQEQMESAIQAFGKKLHHNSVGLFYYSGHGVQYEGSNYLIPIKAMSRVSAPEHLRYKTVDAGYILGVMKQSGSGLNMVFLDACRTNPFRSFSRAMGKGLARISGAEGTLIAYSTAPGKVALDGNTGGNSPYTRQLLNLMKEKHVPVELMLKKVRLNVKSETGGKQSPWYEASIDGDFFFNVAGGESPAPEPQPAPVTTGSLYTGITNTPGQVWKDAATGMKFVWIPSGCFQMGQTTAEKQYLIKARGKEEYTKYYMDELSRHKVCLDGFWMGQHEVTRGEFRQFIKATGYQTDAEKKGTAWIKNKETDWKWKEKKGYHWQKVGYPQEDTHPVVNVSWNDAQAFIKWLNKRTGKEFVLPSEAQWEYACRGGSNAMRFWGDGEAEACRSANVADKDYWSSSFPCSDGYKFTAPVGNYQSNGFGLYDMLGNVWEWCQDIYAKDAYKKHSSKNPIYAQSGSYRVYRGGSWDSRPANVRCADRDRYTPGNRGFDLGFRLLRTN